jgi:hypothetical protein
MSGYDESKHGNGAPKMRVTDEESRNYIYGFFSLECVDVFAERSSGGPHHQ